ncbi:MAG: PEP-CTERM sorting domain-containing protein [bacterium]|nr:PEP-CTERM sorting domain-containing protein [bacterium]
MRYLAILLVVGFMASAADATLYWADDFSYDDGGLTDYDGAGGGTGDDVSGGLWTTYSGATYPGGIDVSGGKALLRQGNPASEDAERLTGTSLAAGETIYASFEFSVEDLRGGVESFDGDQSYFVHFDGYRTRVHLRDAVGGGGGFTLGLSGGSGEPPAIWATDLAFDTPYLGIISYEFDTGVSKLWVDPTTELSTSITDTGSDSGGVDSLCLRQDYVSAGDHGVVSIDSAATGSTFADVIPEPASLALMAMGAMTLLRRRR